MLLIVNGNGLWFFTRCRLTGYGRDLIYSQEMLYLWKTKPALVLPFPYVARYQHTLCGVGDAVVTGRSSGCSCVVGA